MRARALLFRRFIDANVYETASVKQEAFEKRGAHSPLRAATLPFTRCRYCRTPPAHRCPQRRRRQQRQRHSVTKGTAMAP